MFSRGSLALERTVTANVTGWPTLISESASARIDTGDELTSTSYSASFTNVAFDPSMRYSKRTGMVMRSFSLPNSVTRIERVALSPLGMSPMVSS